MGVTRLIMLDLQTLARRFDGKSYEFLKCQSYIRVDTKWQAELQIEERALLSASG
jgi:hypothetical protein